MAMTSRARSISPIDVSTSDEVRPAPVIMATVAEPCSILTTLADMKAKSRTGMPIETMDSARNFPAPVSMRICLNTPPAPVSKMMMPAGARDLPVTLSNSSLLVFSYEV